MGFGIGAGLSSSMGLDHIDVRKTEQTTQTSNKNLTEKQKIQQERERKQQETQQTSLLGGKTSAELENLISQLTGVYAGGITGDTTQQQQALADLLASRATNAQDVIQGQNKAIIGSARNKGEKQLTALQTELAQQAGGSLANTFVTGSTAEGRASLETDLAALEAQLNAKARETQLTESSAALQALSGTVEGQGVNNLTGLLNVLKGAQQTSAKGIAESETTGTDLSRIITEIIKSQGETIGREKGHKVSRSQTDTASANFGM